MSTRRLGASLLLLAMGCDVSPHEPPSSQGGGDEPAEERRPGAEADACAGPLHGDGSRYIVDVATGSDTSCALDNTGDVYCWGDNWHGQAGQHHGESPIPEPRRVESLACMTDITLHNSFGCGRQRGGRAWCWGENWLGDAGPGLYAGGWTADPIEELSGVVQVAAAGALLADGAVHVWGSISYWSGPDPAPLPELTAAKLPTSGWAKCAIEPGGHVRCWGFNGGGGVAYPPSPDLMLPTVVPLPLAAAEVVVGGRYCARLVNGTVWCWGPEPLGGHYDRVGRPPAPIANIAGAISLSIYTSHACAVDGSGQVWCWGRGASGRLGIPNDGVRTEPVLVQGLPPAEQVSCGFAHTCALTQEREVYCWGLNVFGQLGQGDSEGSTHIPQRVDIPLGEP